MSDTEPGEYKQNSHSPDIKRSHSSSRSPSRKSASLRRSYSGSRSRSRSRSYRSRSRSRRRSYRSRTPDRHTNGAYRRYSRSRSRSRSRSHHRRDRDSRSPMSGRKRHIGDRLNPPTGKCLGVFGLSLYTTESDIRGVFNRYGNITNINIVIDQKTGRSRGFGFVYFDDDQDAADAKEKANGMELDGRRIRVDFSITKRAHTPTPGVYVGRPAASSERDRNDRDRYDRGHDRDRHDRYDRGDRDRYRDDYHRRDSYRRSPSPYYSRRRSPSPYHRDSYRDRSPYRSRY